MSRLIDIDDISLRKTIACGGLSAKALWRRIQQQPTIDAVEVVRGEWKPFDQTWGREIWYCTACETSMHMPTRMGKPMYEYCPYCGAKMKGADDE